MKHSPSIMAQLTPHPLRCEDSSEPQAVAAAPQSFIDLHPWLYPGAADGRSDQQHQSATNQPAATSSALLSLAGRHSPCCRQPALPQGAGFAKGVPGTREFPECSFPHHLMGFRIQMDRSAYAPPPQTELQTCQATTPLCVQRLHHSLGTPTKLPPPGSGLTYLPHFTHSSTNMFPWSSASLSLQEKHQR